MKFLFHYVRFFLLFFLSFCKIYPNINTPPSADSRKAVTLFDRGEKKGEAVAVIYCRPDITGKQQESATATDSGRLPRLAAMEEENARYGIACYRQAPVLRRVVRS